MLIPRLYFRQSLATLLLAGGVLSGCSHQQVPQFAPLPGAEERIDLVPAVPRGRKAAVVNRSRGNPMDSLVQAFANRVAAAQSRVATTNAIYAAMRDSVENLRKARPTPPQSLMTGAALEQAFQAEQRWQASVAALETKTAFSLVEAAGAAQALQSLLSQTPPQEAGRTATPTKQWQEQSGANPLTRTTRKP